MFERSESRWSSVALTCAMGACLFLSQACGSGEREGSSLTLAGSSGAAGSSGMAGGAGSAAGGDGAPDGGRDCYPPNPGLPDYACALPEPCPNVLYNSSGTGGVPSIDVNAARCVLTAMRDSTSAHLTLNVAIGVDDGYVYQWWTQSDASAVITTRRYPVDLTLARRFPLKPPSYFDDCLAKTDPGELLRCFRESWEHDACFDDRPLPCAVAPRIEP